MNVLEMYSLFNKCKMKHHQLLKTLFTAGKILMTFPSCLHPGGKIPICKISLKRPSQHLRTHGHISLPVSSKILSPLLMKKANSEYEKNFQSKKCVTVGKILMTLSSCSQQVRKSNFQIDTNLTVNTMKYKIIG